MTLVIRDEPLVHLSDAKRNALLWMIADKFGLGYNVTTKELMDAVNSAIERADKYDDLCH